MRDDPPLELLLEFAVELAWRAGRVTLAHFQTGADADMKADGTPVTVADREAERTLRVLIERRFPHHGILGEEFGETRPDAVRRWLLDPIDGTRSFIRGVPLYGVLIALEEAGEALLGALHFPALSGETVYAARGVGCWWDGRRARVSASRDLSTALVLTTDPKGAVADARSRGWDRLQDRAGLARTWGDCYGHALVATGRAEAMIDPVLAPWDAAALKPVVEEAGGRFTDWAGRATHLGGSGVSTNASLAEEVREILATREVG